MARSEQPAELMEVLRSFDSFRAEFSIRNPDVCVLPVLGQVYTVFDHIAGYIYNSKGKIDLIPHGEPRVLLASDSLNGNQAILLAKFGLAEGLIYSPGLFPPGYFEEDLNGK